MARRLRMGLPTNAAGTPLEAQGGVMRRDWIVGSMTLGLALTSLLAAGPADATPQRGRIGRGTCETFLAVEPENKQRIAYWVDGYQVAKGEAAVSTVAFDKFDRP